MEDLTRYRIDSSGHWKGRPTALLIQNLLVAEVLIPDSTLQDIADAYRIWLSDDDPWQGTEAKLYDLLDALVNE